MPPEDDYSSVSYAVPLYAQDERPVHAFRSTREAGCATCGAVQNKFQV